MPKFWLDTSVYIEAANGPLAFDLDPKFWEDLEADAKAERIASPMFVHREIVDLSGRDDLLAQWAKRMKDQRLLFVEPGEEVLSTYTAIADYVHKYLDPAEGNLFLDEADPWVIAHAMEGGTIVVSQEKRVGTGSKRIKIPNICEHFGIAYIKTVQYLREIKDERG
jgi:hypothetical protein